MRAISLWQPWAQLVVLGIKTLETRSWPCPPSLIGERIAFHAAKRVDGEACRRMGFGQWCSITYDGTPSKPWVTTFNGVDVPLPLGAIVGSGIVEACLPITRPGYPPDPDSLNRVQWDGADLLLRYQYTDALDSGMTVTDLSDQLPYGDFMPGRWAWIIRDAAPTTERCPWCGGLGGEYDTGYIRTGEEWDAVEVQQRCETCVGTGRCEPIPWKGGQRIWNAHL